MPSFRGNVGNLMQHWVLCEVLAACLDYNHVAFIDAYSMAPLANQRSKHDQTSDLFDRVCQRLPGEGTPYERAWYKLAPNATSYPNSASFLTFVWPGSYSLLLCESDPATVRELELWASRLIGSPKCLHIEIAAGDWRARFRNHLPSSGDLKFLSFDPYMFDQHGRERNPGNMNPGDLEQITAAIEEIPGSLLIQLSTYSANNANPQLEVRQVVSSRLQQSGLQEIAVVRANGNMMSLVYGRGVDRVTSLHSLPLRFSGWLKRISRIGSIE